MTLALVWIKFLFCTSLIVYAGYKLSAYGDVIAEKTGLGRTWIGLVLMAGVTSLPELITGVSSVTVADVPNIAIGDLMGSSVFNILIIAMLDLIHGPGPIFSRADHGHILSGGFGIILISLVCVNIFLFSHFDGLGLGFIGGYVPFIILIYLLSMRTIYRFEKRKIATFIEEEALLYKDISKREAYINYVINAVIIIGAGIWLPFIGAEIAGVTGWGKSFVGNIFVALSTSLPELVVSFSALKIGAVDMAIGDLFGSNLFNMNILAIDDLLYVKAPILHDISVNHLVSGFAAIVMTAIAIVGLTFRSEKKAFMRVSWDALAIILVYVINFYLLYTFIEQEFL
jgi:cation:H+ antiporter